MRTLYLLRHAKAASEDLYKEDRDRPLNERGREAATLVGNLMDTHHFAPERILCSSSERTCETWDRLAQTMHSPSQNIQYDDSLYLANGGQLLKAIHKQDDKIKSLLLIGHNPGMHVLAAELAGQGDKTLLSQLRQNFPTAALAVLQFECKHWTDIAHGGGTLTHFLTPKSS